jgi:lysophospholipase L1-like esterase
MKNMIKFILVAYLFISNTYSNTDNLTIISYKDPLLTRRVSWFFVVGNFNEINKNKPIIMIGDSLTFKVDWEKFLNMEGIANAGIGGETSSLILERIDVLLHLKPKVAFLMVGINDFYRDASVDKVFININMIVNRLKEKNIKVNLIATPHCNSSSKINKFPVLCANANIKISKLNSLLKKINTEFIDVNELLSENNELIEDYTSDGVHLNDKGYEVIKNLILSHIS